jgi:hypothetical protein
VFLHGTRDRLDLVVEGGLSAPMLGASRHGAFQPADGPGR